MAPFSWLRKTMKNPLLRAVIGMTVRRGDRALVRYDRAPDRSITFLLTHLRRVSYLVANAFSRSISSMHSIIQHHLPLITSRIEFSLRSKPHLPAITLRQCLLDYNGLNSNDDIGDNVSDGVGDGVGDGAGDDAGDVAGDGVGNGVGDNEGSTMDDDMGDNMNDDEGMNQIPSTSSNAGIGDHFASAPTLIPKPPGEAGRPHSGGFNLKEALAWPKPTYQKIEVSRLIHPVP
jgi:hypothetical protein